MGFVPRNLGAPQKIVPYWFVFTPRQASTPEPVWTCPFTGQWRIVIWSSGMGSGSIDGGGSGHFLMATRPIRAGDVVQISPGVGTTGGSASLNASSVTLATGEVIATPSTMGTYPPLPRPTSILNPFDVFIWGVPRGSGFGSVLPPAGGDNNGNYGASVTPEEAGRPAPGYGPYRGGDGGDGNGNGAPFNGGRVPGGGGGSYNSAGRMGTGGDGMVIIHLLEGLF